mgnify:CR=1 FL=1
MKTTPRISNRPSFSIQEMTKIALIAALYFAVTGFLAPFSFGALQLRLSEMFNYLALFHRRYVLAVTLGVIFANFLSPIWLIDVPVGTFHTFISLIVSLAITKRMDNLIMKMVVMALVFSFSMFIIAGQLYFVMDFPFLLTWLSTGVSELFSMAVGGVIIYLISQKIDLTK